MKTSKHCHQTDSMTEMMFHMTSVACRRHRFSLGEFRFVSNGQIPWVDWVIQGMKSYPVIYRLDREYNKLL